MKNILYLSYTDNLDDKFSGVSQKINSQVNAIRSMGYNVYLAGFYSDLYKLENDSDSINLKEQKVYMKKKILLEFVLKKIIENKIEILYIRMFGASKFFINFLKKLKKIGVKTIMEIPTYPYDKESSSLKGKILNFIDKIYRKRYKNYLDYIVTFSEDEKIYGVKCINISNAVDKEDISSDFSVDRKGDVIRFISVSTLHYWHGIDRLINAFSNYNSLNAILYIVGPDNAYSKKILEQVNNLNLEKKVIFYGYKNKNQLKKLYKKMNIGVGSLGRHRSGIYNVNTLKNKEYCANGLPIIYSENDKDCDGQKFTFKLNADESNINLKEICEWYSNLTVNEMEIIDFAKEFTWDVQLKKVFSILEESNI